MGTPSNIPGLGLFDIPDTFRNFTVREDRSELTSSVERLLTTVQAHIEAEEGSLDQYVTLGEESADPVIKLAMQLIVDDERRHHGLLKRIATSIQDALYWHHSDSSLPTGAESMGVPVSERAIAATKVLIQEEVDGAKMLRDVAHRERSLNGGLISLLLEMMASDSEKHAHILRFIQKRLETRQRAAS